MTTARSSSRNAFDMPVRMNLAELDLDQLDEKVTTTKADLEIAKRELRDELRTEIADLTLKVSKLTTSANALTFTVIIALIGIIGTLIGTR